MLVYPDSQIQFFKDIPLEPGGENKVWYGTTAQKDAAFTTLFSGAYGSGQVLNCSYQRENKNRVLVELPIATLYAANYMRFKNASFENKWFYAFITQVNYINNVTTEVIYQMDYFTTWAGDFTPAMCYVERQHVEDDRIGVNVLEEGIQVGDYITEGEERHVFGRLRICLSYWGDNGVAQSYTGGIYSAAHILETSDPNAIEGKILTLVEDNKKDDIISVFMAPSDFINYDEQNHVIKTKTVDKSVSKPYSTVGGYTPKNNKLFCYPYKYLVADNLEGSVQEFKYEYFNATPPGASSGSCNFRMYGLTTNNTEITLVPRNYGGVEDNKNVRLGQKAFPQCAYAVDSYKAYLAQQNAWLPQNHAKATMERNVDTVAGAASGALNGAMSGAQSVTPVSGALLGGLTGAASGAGNAFISGTANMEKMIRGNLIENQIRVPMPQETHGAVTSDVFSAHSNKGFYFYKKSIDGDVARSIDNFFSMYGYKISKMRVFNMRARETWTYIQTKGCEVGGILPASDKHEINAMFDSGVRVWRRVEDVGNYNLSNNPVTPG